MKIIAPALLFVASFVSVATPALARIEVTRFHTAEVPHGETVALVPGPDIDPQSLEFRNYGNAVAASLTRAGFIVVDYGKPAALTAQVDIETAINRPFDPRAGHKPVSGVVGASTGSYGGGIGLGIGIDLSGPPKAIIGTRLAVRVKRSATGEALWEGRAETQGREGSKNAQPAIVAQKLADALFGDYPGQSGATITVK